MPELRGDERLLVIAEGRSRVAGALLGLFVAVQTFLVLGRADRFEVLLWWQPGMRVLVALLWIKNLGLAALAGWGAARLFRVLVAREAKPRPLGRAALLGGFAAALALGGALRWVAPDLIPPAQWVDTFVEIRSVLRDPAGAPWIGATPFGFGTSDMISNLYARLAALPLLLLGRDAAGYLAISAIPGILTPLACGWVAAEAWGTRAGLLAAILTALSRWPLLVSRWGFTGAAMIPLLATGAAATLAALRTRRLSFALVAGLAFGFSLHTHPGAYAVCGVAGLFSATLLRRPGVRRLVLASWGAALLAFAPFAWGFVRHPQLVGGHLRDVHIGKAVRDVGVPTAGGVLGVAERFAWNGGFYSGIFFGGSDPNVRHGVPGAPVLSPLLCAAALAGAALSVRARDRLPERFVLVLAGGGLLAGVLSDPGGAPNSFRVAALVVPTMAWAARALEVAAERAAPVAHASLSGVLAVVLALAFLLETVPALSSWAFDGRVASAFCVGETRAGELASASPPVVLDPGAVRYPIVVEAFAAGHDARRPAPELPRAAPEGVTQQRAFWYVTSRAGAQRLAARTRVSHPVALDAAGLVLVRAAPTAAPR